MTDHAATLAGILRHLRANHPDYYLSSEKGPISVGQMASGKDTLALWAKADQILKEYEAAVKEPEPEPVPNDGVRASCPHCNCCVVGVRTITVHENQSACPPEGFTRFAIACGLCGVQGPVGNSTEEAENMWAQWCARRAPKKPEQATEPLITPYHDGNPRSSVGRNEEATPSGLVVCTICGRAAPCDRHATEEPAAATPEPTEDVLQNTQLRHLLIAFLEIGKKRDLTNPKYDSYYEEFHRLLGMKPYVTPSEGRTSISCGAPGVLCEVIRAYKSEVDEREARRGEGFNAVELASRIMEVSADSSGPALFRAGAAANDTYPMHYLDTFISSAFKEMGRDAFLVLPEKRHELLRQITVAIHDSHSAACLLLQKAEHLETQLDLHRQYSDKLKSRCADEEKNLAESRRDVTRLNVRVEELEAVLCSIAAWEIPEVEDTRNPGRMLRYETAYGSNGARDFIRRMAGDVLTGTRAIRDAKRIDEAAAGAQPGQMVGVKLEGSIGEAMAARGIPIPGTPAPLDMTTRTRSAVEVAQVHEPITGLQQPADKNVYRGEHQVDTRFMNVEELAVMTGLEVKATVDGPTIQQAPPPANRPSYPEAARRARHRPADGRGLAGAPDGGSGLRQWHRELAGAACRDPEGGRVPEGGDAQGDGRGRPRCRWAAGDAPQDLLRAAPQRSVRPA